MITLAYKKVIFRKVRIKNLPLLARCFIVSICSPDSFAFFIAEVALGHPDKLWTVRSLLILIGHWK